MNLTDVMTYSESSTVIDNILQLLQEFSWIYNFKVTNIFSDNILDTIPAAWRTFLSDLSLESFNDIFIHQRAEKCYDLPEHVNKFLHLYNSTFLSFETFNASQTGLDEDKTAGRGVSSKKKHEIRRFADFIGKPGLQIVDIDLYRPTSQRPVPGSGICFDLTATLSRG